MVSGLEGSVGGISLVLGGSAGVIKLTSNDGTVTLSPASGDGTVDLSVAAAGFGTVTSVSGTNANGVSFSISNPSTSPNITISLGAITPTSIVASGNISGSNLSGTNTGDQVVPANTTATSSQFFTAYNATTGVFTKAQPTASDVSLGNVTNDTQTKAAIVPNTAPSSGQILVGNAGGTAYAPVSASGAFTMSSTGAATIATPGTLTVSSTNSTATAHTHAITSSSAPGAAASILATDASGHIGSTGTRIVKGWFTDLTVTNTIAGSINGNASTVTTNANLTGDVTSVGNATTLATVNSNTGSFGSSTSIPSFTVNGKGLITAASGNAVIAPAGTLSGTTLNSTVVTSSLTSVGAQAQALNMNSHLINNVTDPVSAQDAATKNYVDTVAQGLSAKQSATLATAAALPANTYSNGVSGVGATLTGVATGVLTVDGVTVALNDRIVVKNEATGANNGLYKCTVAGAVGVAYVLTRTTDADTSAELDGAFVFVESGTANTATGWVIANASAITIGTTAITWTQFSGAGTYTAGNGLSLSGSQFSINTAVTVDKTTAQALSNKDMTSGTNTWPTFNQNTTGSAAKWTTARNLAGNSVDGSADVAFANKFIVQGTADSGLSAAQFLGSLGTGIVKNTTTTGVLSIAAAGDFPTLNQNTTGSAATLTTSRNIGGVAFNGSADIVPQTIESANEATDTTCFPLFITASGTQQLQPKNNVNLTFNSNTGALGATSFSGAGTGLTGTASSLTAGDVANASVIAKVLTGYTSGAGTISASDSILTAIQKLNGNDALGAWTAYTPTPTAGSGSFTTVSASGNYRVVGKTVNFTVTVTITTVGTASGIINVPVPTGTCAKKCAGGGKEDNGTNAAVSWLLNTSGTNMIIQKYDGTSIIGTGNVITISGTYETT